MASFVLALVLLDYLNEEDMTITLYTASKATRRCIKEDFPSVTLTNDFHQTVDVVHDPELTPKLVQWCLDRNLQFSMEKSIAKD